MKVSAVRLPQSALGAGVRAAAKAAEDFVAHAEAEGSGLIVFPAFTDDACGGGFFDAMRELSRRHPAVGVCPGSRTEISGGVPYHCAELILGGVTVLRQKQLYLSRRERENGLGRGERLDYADFMGFRTCIIQGADVFYPQVSRLAALEGAELVLFPVAYPKAMGRPLQIAGVWREAQLNMFFAVESCLRGELDGMEYDGELTVQAPLAIEPASNGFLARGAETATAALDREKRLAGISRFDVLAQLNPALYENMGMFGGGKS